MTTGGGPVPGSDLLDPAFLQRLQALEIMARKILSGLLRGDVTTRRRGGGTLFREHRNYTQGDDTRFLDWNVYGRLGDLFVKEFDAEEALGVWLFIDQSASMDWGSRNKARFARQIAAALGFIGLSRQAVVRPAPFPAGGATMPPAFRGRGQALKFLRHLAALEPGGVTDFTAAFRAAAARLPSRGVAIVISDFFDQDGYRRGLRFLRCRGFSVFCIHVVDPEELHPRLMGRVELRDVETGRSRRCLVTGDMMRSYERAVAQYLREVERFCWGSEMGYARVPTTAGLDRAVLTVLREEGLLR